MMSILRQRIKVSWAVVLAIAGMAIAGAVDVSAAAPATQISAANTSTSSSGDNYRSVIKLLDPYVFRAGDGSLFLSAPRSVTSAIGPATMKKVQSGLTVVNGEIRAGRLVATADHRVYDPKAAALSVQGGWTGLRWYWWGFDMYLSEYYTQKFLALAAAGVAILGACMLVPAIANQAACVALAAAIGLLAAIVWFIDNGNGVIFEKAWWSVGTFYGQ